MKVITVAEMRNIEKSAAENGVSSHQLMESASLGIAAFIQNHFSAEKSRLVTGLIGKGNNGGDSLLALTILQQKGWKTEAWFLPSGKISAWTADYQAAGGIVKKFAEDPDFSEFDQSFGKSGLILDGVLGIGCHLPLDPDLAGILGHVKQLRGRDSALPRVIAVDCSSGVDCTSGKFADETIPADLTLCIEAAKEGQLSLSVLPLEGRIECIPLNLQKEVYKEDFKIETLSRSEAGRLLPERALDGNKGTFGNVIFIGGSESYIGAAILSGSACYKMGAGLVKMVIPERNISICAGKLPEAVWYPYSCLDERNMEESLEQILQLINDRTAFIIGPGLSSDTAHKKFLEKLFCRLQGVKNACVIDADALNICASDKSVMESIPENAVLTPHPGEMARLCGKSVEEVQLDRRQNALTFARKWNKVVVLKGALTLIASPDGRLAVNPYASSALAKAGSGDVLSGIIGGLLAQQMNLFDAARLGCLIHAEAGIASEKQQGNPYTVMASDIIAEIQTVLRTIRKE